MFMIIEHLCVNKAVVKWADFMMLKWSFCPLWFLTPVLYGSWPLSLFTFVFMERNRAELSAKLLWFTNFSKFCFLLLVFMHRPFSDFLNYYIAELYNNSSSSEPFYSSTVFSSVTFDLFSMRPCWVLHGRVHWFLWWQSHDRPRCCQSAGHSGTRASCCLFHILNVCTTYAAGCKALLASFVMFPIALELAEAFGS